MTKLAGSANSEGSTDGAGVLARFRNPHGIAIDSAGTEYVADPGVARLAYQALAKGYKPTTAERLRMIAALGGMQVELVSGRIRFDTTAEIMSQAKAKESGEKPLDLSQEKADLARSKGI